MQGMRSRTRAVGRVCLAGGASLLIAALFPLPAAAAPSGTLSMNPANTSLAIGDTVAITLDLSGAVDIHEVHFGVSYNQSVLQVTDADAGAAGTQILPGAFPGTDAEGAVLQNVVSSGVINYQYELNGTDEVSGTGTVATVQFQAVANGAANLAWTMRLLRDGNDVTSTASASSAIVVVGATSTPTDTPTATATGAAATDTPTSTATSTATPTLTRTATGTATVTRTPSPTGTATSTRTPAATSTARITILQNSNATPAGRALGGVDPSQPGRANGLPTAGNEGPMTQMWRWTFFASAIMLAFAGWFFAFAVHYGDREIVLTDRWDTLRKRRGGRRRLPKR